MHASTLALICLLLPWCAQAAVLKCSATYPSGTSVYVDIVTPAQELDRYLTLSGTGIQTESFGSSQSVSKGTIEYRLSKLATKAEQTEFVITSRRPLIGFFYATGRTPSVRIDGEPPNARISYYDSSFSPGDVATGTCV